MATFPYFPQTAEDIKEMLGKAGMASPDELYGDVPAKFLYKGEYALREAMSEQEIRGFFEALAAQDKPQKVFVGQGAYDHYAPSVIPNLLARSEFLTAYTPYQAEISQGTLRYIFEYQSMICALTGMDISNASMYDGATAAAEAVRMAVACAKKKDRVVISDGLLPNVVKVIETYTSFSGVKITKVPAKDGRTDLDAIIAELSAGDVAGVMVPAVNRFGIVEDYSALADKVHEAKAIVIEYCDPSALAVIKTPGEWGFDVAVGDGQSLGIPLCFGGPYVGFMACRKEYVRKLPGRIVGQTVDADGKRCFVLTLQTREQHIRREKATSNICSNESLMALYITVYLSVMGPEGMKEVNSLSSAGAHYLCDALVATGKLRKVFDAPFLKEFVLEPVGISAAELHKKLSDKGFFAALPTAEGYVSFCVTEKRTREEVDALIQAVKEA